MLLSLLLLAVGTFAAVVEPAAVTGKRTERMPPPLEWVRTVDGWERPASWQPPEPVSPALHPLVVAGFVGMAAIAGLLVGPSRRGDVPG